MAAGYRGRSGQEYIYGNTVRAAESAEADYRRRQKKAAELERQTARYPVSYTHLDVYKRQTYYFVETKNPMGYELEKIDPETAKTITLDRTTAGQVLELACTNRRMKGKAVLTKTDETGLPVSGAEYMLSLIHI